MKRIDGGGHMGEDTEELISSARKRFLEADAALYGAEALGTLPEALEQLVRAREAYDAALEQGERALGLKP